MEINKSDLSNGFALAKAKRNKNRMHIGCGKNLEKPNNRNKQEGNKMCNEADRSAWWNKGKIEIGIRLIYFGPTKPKGMNLTRNLMVNIVTCRVANGPRSIHT